MILLADCNSFYASCEEAFQPALAGRPVVVLSNNDGCVVARNQTAKDLGIEMTAPWHLVAHQYQTANVAVCSSNLVLYADMSHRVQAVLRKYAEALEIYSIDECFLEFSPGADLKAVGAEIRARIHRETGIPVSIGIAPTKVLAKAANRQAKRRRALDGVFAWPFDSKPGDELLADMATSDVWGIAGRLAARLAHVGVRTAKELRELPDDVARRVLTVTGLRIVYELRGHSCLDIEEVAPTKKAILCSRSFGQETSDPTEIRAAIASFSATVCEKLRRQNSNAGWLQVFIGTNAFRPDCPQYARSLSRHFLTPTNFTPELTATAIALFERIFRLGFSYKRAGVMVLDVQPDNVVQQAFGSPTADQVARRRRLMTAVDHINGEFGRGSVRCATVAGGIRWQNRQSFRSPCYTTRWSDLPVLL